MAIAKFYANGIDLASLGFRVDNPIGNRRQIPLRPEVVSVPRSAGAMYSHMDGVSRKVTVSGAVLGSSWSTCESAQDALIDILSPGLVTLEERSDARSLVMDGVLDGQPSVSQYPRSFRQRAARFSFSLLSLDGFWRSGGLAVGVASTNTRYALPQGTAPAPLVIRQMGAATNPAITLRGADGQVLGALTFTVTLSSSEWLDIDSERGVIEKVSSGARTNGVSLLTSGTFPVRLPLGSWSYPAALWPTIETSAGSAEVLYAPRYM